MILYPHKPVDVPYGAKDVEPVGCVNRNELLRSVGGRLCRVAVHVAARWVMAWCAGVMATAAWLL